jgi:hypothetical protein
MRKGLPEGKEGYEAAVDGHGAILIRVGRSVPPK